MRHRVDASSLQRITTVELVVEVSEVRRRRDADAEVALRLDFRERELRARLQQAGATEVVPEAFEGSLMLGSHALVLLGVPLPRVVRLVREARDSRYHLLRGTFHGADDPSEFDDEVFMRRISRLPISLMRSAQASSSA